MPMKSDAMRIALIGICIDAGAGRRGARLGPFALRSSGLSERLAELDIKIEDWGDLSGVDIDPARKPAPLPKPPSGRKRCLHLRPKRPGMAMRR